MNRTLRIILAVLFVLVIMFAVIVACQNLGKRLRYDITDRKIYTLSDGTKAILSKLNQPITLKLYYTKTAAMKAPDQIRFLDNYFHYVQSMLEEYELAGKGMVDLQVIDPRPFSNEEVDAMRAGLKRIPMSEEEGFFFGLALQTQFGLTKTIPFFAPDRQQFLEYDISYLIDTSIQRQKKVVGVLSSLPVMGDETSGYMAQMMRMQGQQPREPWAIIQQMRETYEVKEIKPDTQDIDADILLVIHPKDFDDKTLFAIDQYILKGGKAIVFVDPHCMIDPPTQQMQMMRQQHSQSSNPKELLKAWGLRMPENTFAGDRELALIANLGPNQNPQKIIGFLGLTRDCFNDDSVITANLNEARFLFAGALETITPTDPNEEKISYHPLVSTTDRGNTWSVSSPFELMMPNPAEMMRKFYDGTKPINMGYLVSGKFESAFPDGVEVKDESDPNSKPEHLSGLTESASDCVVAVYSDVDFISDMLSYQESFFGKIAVADNASILLNTLDEMAGSTELISIRSRGGFQRPFEVVDKIEAEAEAESAEEERKIMAEIQSGQNELNEILSTAKKGEEEIVGSSILEKKQEIELKIHEAQMRLRDLKMNKRENIEKLGDQLRNFNTLPGPAIILVIAIILGLYRSTKKRHYISHASDA